MRSFGPQWGDKFTATLYHHTGNSNSNSNHLFIIKNIEYKYKNYKRPADDRTNRKMKVQTDGHIITPLMRFYPVACGLT